MKEIYLDNSATTYVRSDVLEYMTPYFEINYGNPSSLYNLGLKNRKCINECRQDIARLFNCTSSKEIYFTSCGTESNNWALKSACMQKKRGHIIVSAIEHSSILESSYFLRKLGYDVTYLSVDVNGIVSLKELEKSIRKDTILVSIMYVNNEIGVIEPIKDIASICKKYNILLHTDAIQAVPHMKINVQELGIDMMSVSGHKVYGPKGIGFLYVKKNTPLIPFIHGGHQENGMRGGTENTANIIGLTKGLELCDKELEENTAKFKKLRNRLIHGLSMLNYNYIEVCSDINNKVDSILNICFENVNSKILEILLSEKNIYVSTGSACNSGIVAASHVLQALNISNDYINGALRISLGKDTSEEDIDILIETLRSIFNNKLSFIQI
ncbi:MAG: cysteine desulfurase family protein [Lachnotalea sp.]